MVRVVLLIAGVLLTSVPAPAAQLIALWDYPATAPPGVTFVLTMLPATGADPQQRSTTGTPCPTEAVPTSTTRCSVFACPAPGVYTFWVQASQGSQMSATSNVLTCQITGDTPCTCTTLDNTIPSSAPNPANVQVASTPPPATTVPSSDTPPVSSTAPAAPPPVAVLQPLRTDATNLVLSWDYPRDAAQVPTRFLISYTTNASPTPALYAVPVHEVTACSTLPSPDANIWCARLACPGLGTFTFTVEADYGDHLGTASNVETCTIASPSLPCTCTPTESTRPPAVVSTAPLSPASRPAAAAAPVVALTAQAPDVAPSPTSPAPPAPVETPTPPVLPLPVPPVTSTAPTASDGPSVSSTPILPDVPVLPAATIPPVLTSQAGPVETMTSQSPTKPPLPPRRRWPYILRKHHQRHRH